MNRHTRGHLAAATATATAAAGATVRSAQDSAAAAAAAAAAEASLSGERVAGTPGYIVAVGVCVPAVLVALLALLLYIYCSKRYRLNWYERTLLEESARASQSHTGLLAGAAAAEAEEEEEAAEVEREHEDAIGPLLPRASLPGVLMSGGGGGKVRGGGGGGGGGIGSGGRSGSFKAEWLLNVRKMGSGPSSPTAPPSDASEKFWVPPAIVERKRAQSLVPTLSRHDSDEEVSSGAVTPNSIPGIRELTFTFPGEKLMGSEVLPPTLPSSYNPGRRRASMHDAIDLTKIDMRLYDKKPLMRQNSVTSLQEEGQCGSIQFTLEYTPEIAILAVTLNQARELESRDFSGSADPYVKVTLLPERRAVLQSKIHKKTLDPVFDEQFMFEVSPAALGETSLHLMVFHYDQFSQDECIGTVTLPLKSVDLAEKVTVWRNIVPCDKSKETRDHGDVMLSMSYLPSAERLTVVIAKGRNLRHREEGKITLDPYVKVTLYVAGKKLKKKKTSTKHNTPNPEWNEALIFNLSRDVLEKVCIQVTLFHDNKIGNDEFLGKVRLSSESSDEERAHWRDLIHGQTGPARWHSLKS